jgi:4-hydroxy-3-polyprenylbenzoate decarboxylase
MMGKSGSHLFIDKLKKNSELIEVQAKISPELEITEVTDRFSKLDRGGKAILFTNNGSDFPVLTNGLGSMNRIKIAFGGKDPDSIAGAIDILAKDLTGSSPGFLNKIRMIPRIGRIGSLLPKKVSRKGLCQEVVMDKPDLGKLPVLKCWPHDGGPFITLPLVHTLDPQNGKPNLGMYRMHVFDNNTTGMHWHMHKTGARHYRAYKKAGKRMPVAVALGGDPVYTYCATAPLPDGIDEYILAGYIRNKPVKLVKCLTQELWVPDDADFIIEGYVDPEEELAIEGPFGDHTGFYSLADLYPRFHVTCITHRKNAVYPATIVGIPPQEDAWIAVATEKLFLPPIKLSIIPELVDMHMPEPGVAHNIALFSIKSEYPGQGKKVLSSMWGAGQMMFNKFGLVIGEEADLRDYKSIAREACQRINPARDLFFGEGPLDVLDHSARTFAYGGKLGFDATGEKHKLSFASEGSLLDRMASFRNTHPEIVNVNTSLLREDIPVIIISIRKSRPGQTAGLSRDIRNEFDQDFIPFWIFTDDNVRVDDMYMLSWIVGNHTDPSKDAWTEELEVDNTRSAILFIDATRKTSKLDGFERD